MNKFAVIGFGRWGKDLIGEFNKLGEVLYAVNKGGRENIKWLEKNYPKVKYITDIDIVLHQKDIESMIIATPISTHYSIAKKSLEFDKNIFVKKLKKIISRELPQETRFFWLKWGTFDSNIVWNLAYHDIYLSLNLYGEPQRSRIIFNSANKVQIEMVYKNHKVAILVDRSYKGLPTKSVTVKLGSKNYILQNSSLYKLENNKKKLLFKSKRSPLGIASERFLNEIHKKNKNYSDFELSIETVRIIEKMTVKNLL